MEPGKSVFLESAKSSSHTYKVIINHPTFLPMFNEEDWINIGKLLSPQGLKGEIRVKPLSDFPERFTEPGKRWLQRKEEKPKEVELIKGRQLPGKAIYIVRFAGVENRTAAEELINQNLLVPSFSRPKMNENEFHLLDLVGLEARLNADGPAIGQITNLTNAGNDLLEIELLEGKKVLVPFVKAIVPEIQLKEGWLIITPPTILITYMVIINSIIIPPLKLNALLRKV